MKPLVYLERGLMIGFIMSLLLFSSATIAHAAPEADSKAEDRDERPGVVYAKIILPMKATTRGNPPKVESWIAKQLRKRGHKELRAVTSWIRLAEPGEKSAHVWNATVDGKLWGCPVAGRVDARTSDGKVKVQLLGWSPGGADLKGDTLPAETGSRSIVSVNIDEEAPDAYVALLIGPSPAKAEHPRDVE